MSELLEASATTVRAMVEDWNSTVRFFVNGKEKRVRNADPEETLLEYLRRVGITGTKLGCGEGGCGAGRTHGCAAPKEEPERVRRAWAEEAPASCH